MRVDAFPRELGLFESMASGLRSVSHAIYRGGGAAGWAPRAEALLEALFEPRRSGWASGTGSCASLRVNRLLANERALGGAHKGRPRPSCCRISKGSTPSARLREIVETGLPWMAPRSWGDACRPGAPHLARTSSRSDGRKIVGLGAVIVDVTEELAQTASCLCWRGEPRRSGRLKLFSQLRLIVELAVPDFADWCALVLLEGGEARHAAVAASDRATVEKAREMLERLPVDLRAARGVGRVIREGVPDLVPEVEAVPEGTVAELRRMVWRGSARTSPCRWGQAGVMGALCFATGREALDDRSLRFGVELARRLSPALENSASSMQLGARRGARAVPSCRDLRAPLSPS
jgi:hypothetical protein